MRQFLIAACAVGGLALTTGAAMANGGDKCFDKGTLTYVDCNPTDWSGWYLGAHAGWDPESVTGDFRSLSYDDLELEGFVAGGQLGFQEQLDNGLVLGIELDASAVWADDEAIGALGTSGRDRISAELNWLASARLRVGLAQGDWMPYITGGVALGGFEASATDSLLANTINVEETVFGGVAGGGVEIMLDENWILGAEGLYYFFDGDTHDLSSIGFAGDSVEFGDVLVGRARLSYKF